MHDSRRSSADMMAEAAKRPGATLAKIPDGLKMGEDFPFICDICLGPNPYIRMMKLPMARECKISGLPAKGSVRPPGDLALARHRQLHHTDVRVRPKADVADERKVLTHLEPVRNLGERGPRPLSRLGHHVGRAAPRVVHGWPLN